MCDGANDNEFHLGAQVLINEAILTAIFITTILMIKGGSKTSPTGDGVAGPLAIALALLACIRVGGKLGGCFNPAVGLSVGVFSSQHLEDNNSLKHYMYAFILGPFIGGVIAGAFSLVHRKRFDPKDYLEKTNYATSFTSPRII